MVSNHMFSQGIPSCTNLGADFANHPGMVFNMISFNVTRDVLFGLADMATFYAAIFVLTDGQNLGVDHHIKRLVA